ncbi:aspartyl protease domain-containing protein [Ditylenchus destructor]|uniref:Aspartyl protease domain-containing protein n=1 Tax=Ditylenchus destructor TaxID=166010 RepID=A0AAD4MJZ1_9BILA|nr:aspartyl protease domain-containing protein [Ditylenchus destructor]
MLLTVVFGESTSYLEIFPDMDLEAFVQMCLIEIPALSRVTFSAMQLVCNGTSILLTRENMQKEIQSFGIKDGDLVNIQKNPIPAAQPRSQPSAAQMPSSSSGAPNINALVSNLVKSIKVPGTVAQDDKERKMTRNLFESLVNPGRVDYLRAMAPDLVAAYEANSTDYEAFHKAYIKYKEEDSRRNKLMYDENSEEGQRLIAERIAKENIEMMHQHAMEHMPEAFIPVYMLYIKMKINNHPVIAFVDSGAQASILSESCAKRCDVFRFADTRFRAVAQGVGGSEKFTGRIHSCQVQVENHFFLCPFDVMPDRNMDILFGLNALRRHHCCIDLKKGVLRFGDGTETPFLDEEAHRREMQAIGFDSVDAFHQNEDQTKPEGDK